MAHDVKGGIESNRVGILPDKKKNPVETLWVEIQCLNRKSLLLRLYYWLPDLNGASEQEILKELKKAAKAENTIILGDFNYPHIDWVNLISGRDAETELLESINCVSPQTDKRRDHFTFNPEQCSDLIQGVIAAGPICNSDHNVIKFDSNIRDTKSW